MGIFSDKSYYEITTEDDYVVKEIFETRDEAFKQLIDLTKNIYYKSATVCDFDTDYVVVALRTIK